MNKKDMLGLVIGDGYISKSGALTIRHGLKQREYLEYKYSEMKKLYEGRNFHLTEVPSQNGVQLSVCDAKLFKAWRKWIYPQGKKLFTSKLLNKLTPQAIAFWYCDDGSMYYKKRNGRIHAIECVISTCCSLDEINTIIDYFNDKWNISMTRKKENQLYSVRFGTKSARTFVDHFGSYVPSCMSYKIDKVKDFKGNWL